MHPNTADGPDPVSGSEMDTPAYPTPKVAWISTLLLMLLFAVAYMDRQIISLMVQPISTEFGIGDFEISLLQGFAFAVLYALCGLPLGMAVDRFPRRYIILVGVLVWSLAAMACGLARSFDQMLVARVLVGAGEAALSPAAYAILADLFPRRKLTFALSVFMMGALIGSEGSLALGGTILHEAADGVTLPVIGHLPAWRFAFLVTGAPGLLLAFLALLIHEPARVRAPAGSGVGWSAGWGEVLRFMAARKRFFFVQMIGFASVMALVYARLAWNPTFLMRTYHWPVAQVSYALATFGLITGAPALLLGGKIVDWLFARGHADAHFRYYAWGGLILSGFGVAAYLSPAPLWFFILAALPAFPLNMGAIGASAVQLVTPAHLRGRVSAVYLMAVSLFGMTAGPALVGYLTSHIFTDPQSINVAMAIAFGGVGLLVALLFAWGMPAMRRAVAQG